MARTADEATPDHRYTGTRALRVEDPRLLTGTGTYVDDIVRPGMLHACFVRSPVARARIAGIDVSQALRLDGVHAVVVARDLNPGVCEQWYTLNGRDDPDTPRPPLAEGEVRFVGDPVAMVVAVDRYIAEDAAELVVVDYDELPPVVDYATALESPESVHASRPGNLVGELAGRPMEELAPVFQDAEHVVGVTVHQQAYSPVPLETRGIVAEWFAPAREMTIWAATQSPHEVRSFCARLLGVDEHRVRVVMRDTGGGFGQKVLPQREDMCVMLAAAKLPAALKWIEDRQEHLLAAGQARHEHGEARLALDADGRILAATLDHVQDVGAYPTPSPVQSGIAVGLLFPGPLTASPRAPSAPGSCSPTPAAGWPTAARGSSSRWPARSSWTPPPAASAWTRSTCAAGTCCAVRTCRRRTSTACPYDHITPYETFEQALEMLDHPAFKRE